MTALIEATELDFLFEGGAFLRLAGREKSRRWRKDVLRVGRWIHPDTGQEIDITRDLLAAIAANTNAFLSAGHEVFFPNGHTSDVKKNLGQWSRFEIEDDVLFAVADVADDEAAEAMGKTITRVSPHIKFKGLRTSSGKKLGPLIMHVAATPAPVIPGQGNFMLLSLKTKETTMPPKTYDLGALLLGRFSEEQQVKMAARVAELADEGMDEAEAIKKAADEVAGDGDGEDDAADAARLNIENPAEAVAFLKDYVGIGSDVEPGDAEAQVIEAVRQVFKAANPGAGDGEGGEGDPPAPPASMAREGKEGDVELSQRVSVLEAENKKQAEELKKTRRAAAERELEDARSHCVGAGVLIPKERSDMVLSLFDEGREAEAREILSMAREQADAVKSKTDADMKLSLLSRDGGDDGEDAVQKTVLSRMKASQGIDD